MSRSVNWPAISCWADLKWLCEVLESCIYVKCCTRINRFGQKGIVDFELLFWQENLGVKVCVLPAFDAWIHELSLDIPISCDVPHFSDTVRWLAGFSTELSTSFQRCLESHYFFVCWSTILSILSSDVQPLLGILLFALIVTEFPTSLLCVVFLDLVNCFLWSQ